MAKKPDTFEIEKEIATCANVNVRAEPNGDEKIIASDVKLVWHTDNNSLAMFHPKLKSSFYDAPDGKQGELIKESAHRPILRFPAMTGALHWELKLQDVKLFMALVGKKTEVAVDECTAGKFQIEMLEGGKVAVTFTVQCHPNESQRGKLTAMVGQEVNVNLTGTTFVAAKDDGDGPLFDEGGEAPEKKLGRWTVLDGTR